MATRNTLSASERTDTFWRIVDLFVSNHNMCSGSLCSPTSPVSEFERQIQADFAKVHFEIAYVNHWHAQAWGMSDEAYAKLIGLPVESIPLLREGFEMFFNFAQPIDYFAVTRAVAGDSE